MTLTGNAYLYFTQAETFLRAMELRREIQVRMERMNAEMMEREDRTQATANAADNSNSPNDDKSQDESKSEPGNPTAGNSNFPIYITSQKLLKYTQKSFAPFHMTKKCIFRLFFFQNANHSFLSLKSVRNSNCTLNFHS